MVVKLTASSIGYRDMSELKPLPEGASGQETIVWWPLSKKPTTAGLYIKHNGIVYSGAFDDDKTRFHFAEGVTNFCIQPDDEDIYLWAYAPKGPEATKPEENEE